MSSYTPNPPDPPILSNTSKRVPPPPFSLSNRDDDRRTTSGQTSPRSPMLGMTLFSKRSRARPNPPTDAGSGANRPDSDKPPPPPPKLPPPPIAPWNAPKPTVSRGYRSSPQKEAVAGDSWPSSSSSGGTHAPYLREPDPGPSPSLSLSSDPHSPTSPTFSSLSHSSATPSMGARPPPSSFSQEYLQRSVNKSSTPSVATGSSRSGGSMLKNMRSWKGASSTSLVSSEGDREPRVTIPPPNHGAPSDPSPVDKPRHNISSNTSAVAAFAAEKMLIFGRLAVGKVRAAADRTKHREGSTAGYGSESDTGRGSSGEHMRRYIGSDREGSTASLAYHDDGRHSGTVVVPTAGGLGILLRPPLPVRGTGRVFGRDLVTCVRDTKAHPSSIPPDSEPVLGNLGGCQLEKRSIPALLLRCARHIERWGLDEEGLFRISGRSTHMSKLRTEFDAGADWDLTPLTPADLDPHAVAGIFKAYFRELPEPVLTRALGGLFDAALYAEENGIDIEAHTKDFKGDQAAYQSNLLRGMGVGLPSGPGQRARSATDASMNTPSRPSPKLVKHGRKPSSTGPSQPLVEALISLLLRLPNANLDVLATLIELIRATSDPKRVKQTKMPLGNLLLVFCPSVGVTPSVMRVLCESDAIWEGVRRKRSEMEAVLDISSRPSSAGTSEEAVANPPSNARPPRSQAKRVPVPALLDLDHRSGATGSSQPQPEFLEGFEPPRPRRLQRSRQHRTQMSLDSNAVLSGQTVENAPRPELQRKRSQSAAGAIGYESRQSSGSSSLATYEEANIVSPSTEEASGGGSDNRGSVITVTQGRLSGGRLSLDPARSVVGEVPEDHEGTSPRSAESSLSSCATSAHTGAESMASTPVSDVSPSPHPLEEVLVLNLNGEDDEDEKRKTLIAIPRSPVTFEDESGGRRDSEHISDEYEFVDSPLPEESVDIKMLRRLKELSEAEMKKRGLQGYSIPSPLPGASFSRQGSLRQVSSLKQLRTSDLALGGEDKPSPAHSLPPSSLRDSTKSRMSSLLLLRRKSIDLTALGSPDGLSSPLSAHNPRFSTHSEANLISLPPKLTLPFDSAPSSPLDFELSSGVNAASQLFDLKNSTSSSSTSTLPRRFSRSAMGRARSSPGLVDQYLSGARLASSSERMPIPATFLDAPVIAQSVSSPPVLDFAPESPVETDWASSVLKATEGKIN